MYSIVLIHGIGRPVPRHTNSDMRSEKKGVISRFEKPQTYLAYLVGFLVGALSGLPSGHEREGALVGTE